MTSRVDVPDRFTFYLPRDERARLHAYATALGVTMGECLRRILGEKLAQLAQQEERTP